PSFSNLSDTVKQQIVEYIKTISPAFKNAQPPQAIPDPKNLKAKPDLKKGAEVFAKLQCALCHGQNGRANGTSAFTLLDAWQRPIRPADLTEGWTYRGGARPIDVYHRILAGIDGAPMPSYEGAITHEEVWELANYVASLQLPANFSGEVVAERVSGDLPAAANDAAWKSAPMTMVNMQNFLYGKDGKRQRMTVNAVAVQALFNDKGVAFKLGWDDPTKSTGTAPDQILLATKPLDYHGEPRGNLLNLYDAKDALDFTLWKAWHPEIVTRSTASIGDAVRAGWGGTQNPAAGEYDDGRWTVVFKRDFDEKSDAIRDNKSRARIGFAAWDGSDDETGLRYSASDWVWLDFGAPAGHH
ncbi:MAG: c-type cytochrome, partial [Elusimicrobia bacterium]|nr:c-type cytochrome [Elusimicrobiota bacterium]